jgi:hypothetical protein
MRGILDTVLPAATLVEAPSGARETREATASSRRWALVRTPAPCIPLDSS